MNFLHIFKWEKCEKRDLRENAFKVREHFYTKFHVVYMLWNNPIVYQFERDDQSSTGNHFFKIYAFLPFLIKKIFPKVASWSHLFFCFPKDLHFYSISIVICDPCWSIRAGVISKWVFRLFFRLFISTEPTKRWHLNTRWPPKTRWRPTWPGYDFSPYLVNRLTDFDHFSIKMIWQLFSNWLTQLTRWRSKTKWRSTWPRYFGLQ